jgi:asparagine synthase (glutamine-hydrolysing)
MSAAIAHRGPDGEGIYLTREHEPITPDTPQVGFVFRRLAILDPDPRAMQPMTIGPLTMVFNGEIYNFRDLKSEISNLRRHYQWRTTGDTEVLLMSYEVWREKCVEKLNGMFAMAVWDEREKTLYLARDRMGQKPLYIYRTERFIAFGSEPATVEIGTELSTSDYTTCALTGFLRYGYAAHGAFSNNLHHQLPSSWARYGADEQFDADSYFDQNNAPEAKGSGASGFRGLMLRAVERQLVSDAPLGVFLSGGIDSSVVTACARKFGPVDTFSIAFDDPRYDESPYAREVAKHLRTNHHEFRVTPNVIEDLPKLAAVFGEPFADSSAIPTHYLSRETRKHVKVALSGDGGDELFGGYDRYRAMQLAHRLRGVPRAVGRIARPWTAGHPKSKLSRAARFAASLGLEDAARYDSYMRIFEDATIAALLPDIPERGPGVVESTFRHELERTGDVVRAALATDRVTYLPDDLLTKVDRASMLHGLEVRSPFMDHELVQFAAGLTTDQLLKGGPKRMLREAFAADLPDFVFKRPKMGFAVPIGEWFRGELRPMLHDHLFAADSFARQHFNMQVVERLIGEHETERADHSQRLYALLMLELWWTQQRS